MKQETVEQDQKSDHAAAARFAERFARFWTGPDPELVHQVVLPDVVSFWPGGTEPVHGPAEYAKRIARIVALVPDIRLEVVEHAQNGDVVFIHWIMRGTGMNGPVEFSGVDRFRLRDGRVAENFVFFDTAIFDALVGQPWVDSTLRMDSPVPVTVEQSSR